MFLPISISAISIDKISNAVPESNPLSNTVFEIESGFCTFNHRWQPKHVGKYMDWLSK